MPEATEPTRVRIVVDVPQVWAWGETAESLAAKMLPHFDVISAEWVVPDQGRTGQYESDAD